MATNERTGTDQKRTGMRTGKTPQRTDSTGARVARAHTGEKVPPRAHVHIRARARMYPCARAPRALRANTRALTRALARAPVRYVVLLIFKGKERMKVQEKIEMLAVATLAPYARNSRTHSKEQIAQIARSMQEFGFTNPVLIDGNGGIVAGHGRVLAAQSLGVGVVPCLRVDWLTEAQKRAYVIADNQLALQAGWDDVILSAEIKELQQDGFALELLGFSNEDLDGLLGDAVLDQKKYPEACPPVVVRPVSVLGDIWHLGQHRLICGDCTTQTAMDALMNGDLADVCWTDPPYNVKYETAAGKIDNDDLDDASFAKFLGDFYRTTYSAMKPGAAIYVAHAETERSNFTREMLNNGFKLSGVVIWRKNTLVLGRSDYQWIHEPILYGWKKGGPHRWFGGRKKTTVEQLGDGTPFVKRADGKWELHLGGGHIRGGGEGGNRGTANLGNLREQTATQRRTPNHEAGRADRAPTAKQRAEWRHRAGCVWRIRQHTNGRRAAWHESAPFGTIPQLRRRHRSPLARLHRPARNPCRNWSAVPNCGVIAQ